MSTVYRQIPNLAPAVALTGTEQLEIVQAGVSRRTTTLAIAGLQGGPTGPTGPSSIAVGPTGPTGPSGNVGPPGPGGTGTTGATGPTGPTGAASSLAGPTGPTGSTGAAGANGTNGPTGPTGPAATGSVTSVTAGTGLNVGAGPGGTITTTGTLNLAPAAVATIGGTQSKAVVASNFLTGISTAGVVTAAQPAFTDISGAAVVAQLPTGISSSASTVPLNNDTRLNEWPVSVDFGQPASAYTATVSFPIAGTFPANMVFRIWASTNSTSTMSVVWKSRISGATAAVGTLSISTAGVITGVANILITVAAGDAFTFDVPADATFVGGISFAGIKI